MILRALYDLALREDLDPTYEPKEVHYLIRIDRDGRFIGVSEPREEPIVDVRGRKKGKPRPPKRPIPRRSDRTTQDRAEFLVDKAEYVLGLAPEQGDAAARAKASKRAEIRRALFLDSVELAARSLPDNQGLRAVAAFLRSDATRRTPDLSIWIDQKLKDDPKALDAALLAFVYASDGGAQCVHDSADVRAYFARAIAATAAPTKGWCLVTGERDSILADLHAKPKGIPPVSVTKGGVPLTSVNKPAFSSYGLDAFGCAPVSITANLRIDAALTRLLDPAYPGPDGNPMPVRRVELTRNTVLVFWSREDASLDFLANLDGADPEQVRALLQSPYKGRPSALEDAAAFYALVLSGTQGRGIVRSFVESTVRDVARNVERYFEETRICRPYGQQDGTPPLVQLRRSLVFQGELDRLSPDLAVKIYLAILYGRRYPRVVLDTAVRRNRVDLLPEKGLVRDVEALASRCSLIKAYLIRNLGKEVSVSLDISRAEPAYRLGRLLAALDKIQAEALGNVNATIVDRYYGSASSTPAAVLPTLVRRSQHHLGKLRREKRGLGVVRERLVQEVMSGLTAFPTTLSLEEQGLFALGFYHQRQDFYVKKEGDAK
jgi:CRISPR-associated protein Csd1